jgi:TRAP-type C4-dicarboxylate transport system permease small subunit
MSQGATSRTAVDRFIDGIEQTAAIFLAAVTALVFFSILLRGLFSYAIPDWYDFSRLMLGVMIFWGIAGASCHNRHIKVDILWEWAGPRARRWIDIVASLILLAFLVAFSVMLVEKVRSGFVSSEATFDMRVVIWPFHLAAALGVFAATALMVIRLVRLFQGKDDSEPLQPYE